MPENFLRKLTRAESIVIVVIMLAIICFCILLVRNIQQAKLAGAFQEKMSISDLLLQKKRAKNTNITDVQYIGAWMTFQYVNFIFNLPEEYLRTSLQIRDTNYPNITLGKYLRKNKLIRGEFITSVQKAVRAYLVTHPLKQ